jgi:hypothetical protein
VGIHIGEPGEWSADWPGAEVAFVDADFFDVLGVRVVAGRGLPSADAEDAGDAAVVNRAFTEEVLGGRNPVGRRVRYALGAEEERGAWWTVVGVVEDLATDQQGLDSGKRPALYRSLWWRAGPEAGAYSARAGDEEDYAVGAGMVSIGHVGEVVEGDRYTVRMAVHLRGAPGTFAPRLRELAMDVEPALRVKDLLPLDTPPAMARGVRSLNELIGWAVAAIVLTVLLVSAAGTYSLMSFTVAQRTREIGIRSALGANPGRLVGEIFAGALRRLVLGVVLGGLAWLVPMAWLASVQSAPTDYARAVGVLVAVGAIVLGVALLACGIPAKRALSIEPTEALRGGS